MPLLQRLTTRPFHFMQTEAKPELRGFCEKRKIVTFGDYTSYFANVKNLPGQVVPISICGKAPDSWKGLQFKKLAPKIWFFKQRKETGDNDFYISNFNIEVLSKLDPDKIWNELREMSGHLPFALICHEKPNEFCHRHLVSAWLRRNGYEIKEFKS